MADNKRKLDLLAKARALRRQASYLRSMRGGDQPEHRQSAGERQLLAEAQQLERQAEAME